jgi:hypothetical protein|tara:strand:+ start:249 stop:473 length:225 start_codon:yes stop_codon:yes gene_type:complete
MSNAHLEHNQMLQEDYLDSKIHHMVSQKYFDHASMESLQNEISKELENDGIIIDKQVENQIGNSILEYSNHVEK